MATDNTQLFYQFEHKYFETQHIIINYRLYIIFPSDKRRFLQDTNFDIIEVEQNIAQHKDNTLNIISNSRMLHKKIHGRKHFFFSQETYET